MENNEENLNSQTTTNSTQGKATNVKLIGIIVAAIVIILAVFFMVFTRSAKATVKDYIKAMENADAGKITALMDFEALSAYESTQSDLSKFDASYKEEKDKVKELSKEKKKEYDDAKDTFKTTIQPILDIMKDQKIKYDIKNIKTEKVEGSKKLVKVVCDIKMKQGDEEQEVKGAEFYVVKNGLKYYIVSSAM